MRTLGHVIAASLLCTVFGGVAFFWRSVNAYANAPNDTPERLQLQQRVRYLTQRFTRKGKRWQFVVWGRQVSLFLVAVALDLIYFSTSKQYHRAMAYVGASCACIILLAFLALLRRREPYQFLIQQSFLPWLAQAFLENLRQSRERVG